MVYEPSGIKRPQGTRLRLLDVGDGRMIVENAYEGTYEYFPNRPIEQANSEVRDSEDNPQHLPHD